MPALPGRRVRTGQRRFVHIIERDRKTGEIRVKPGRDAHVEAYRTCAQDNVERRPRLRLVLRAFQKRGIAPIVPA